MVEDIIDYTGTAPDTENLSAAEYAIDVANKLSEQEESYSTAEAARVEAENTRKANEGTSDDEAAESGSRIAQEKWRQANEVARQKTFSDKLTEWDGDVDAAVAKAENVNAELDGTVLKVTDHDNVTTETDLGAIAMHVSLDEILIATDKNGKVWTGFVVTIMCHLAKGNTIISSAVASFNAGGLYQYITFSQASDGSFYYKVAVPSNYQTYVGDYIDIVLTYDGHSYIKSLHVIPAKQGEKGEDGADGADGKDGGVIFPEMTYDPETGLLTINGDEGVVDRFTYNTTTGLLTIKISNI